MKRDVGNTERWSRALGGLALAACAFMAPLPLAVRVAGFGVLGTVLILRDLEGLSGEQTCQALGLEQATMKTRLHRARAQLREALLRRGARSGHGKELS